MRIAKPTMVWAPAITLLAFSLLSTGFSYGEIIPKDRRITWEGNVGVPGGIPNRTTIYATIDAATYGSGTADATGAIQKALNGCPADQVVYLPAGTYRINGRLQVPSHVTLRGAGPSQTKLDAHGSGAAVISFGQGVDPYARNSVAITGGTTAGSNTITLASAGGIAVGSYLVLTQLNDPSFVTIDGIGGKCSWCDNLGGRGQRALGQIVEVTSVEGTNIGIAPSVYLTYSKALSPLALPFAAGAKLAGVEDLQISMNKTRYRANILMRGCAYCWIKNIESHFTDGDHVEAFWCYRGEIRDSYFHDAFNHGPGQTDADVFIASKTSGFLVENNILRRMHAAIMLNWGAAGNVIAYNFCDGCFDDRQSARNVLMMDLTMHGAHPSFNLIEGNVAASFHPDSYWGSSSHNTAFRNWLKGTTQICEPLVGRGPAGSCYWAVQANRAINLDFACRYYNFSGNLAGSSEMISLRIQNGKMPMRAVPIVVAPQKRPYEGESCAYSFGYGGAGDDGSWSRVSKLPFTTALIHGDFNWVTQKIVWDPNISDHRLPDSLYLKAKPSWWGDLPWPAFGPDPSNPSQVLKGKIPAQVRYEAISRTADTGTSGSP